MESLDELFQKFFKNPSPWYSYTIYTYTYDSNAFVKSEAEKELDGKISTLEKQMHDLTNQLKFEEAIVLRDQIQNLKLELSEVQEKQKSELEKNKSSKQIMQNLRDKLDEAVRTEDFETAAQIRDQIKQSFEKTEKTK